MGTLVERLTGAEAAARMSADEFSALLHELRTAIGLALTVDLFKAHGYEGIWILRRDH
jgi:hypothetical protein